MSLGEIPVRCCKGRDIVEVLTELGKVRNPLYAAANLHIRSDASPHGRTVENILKALAAMTIITVDLADRPYDIHVKAGLLEDIAGGPRALRTW